MVFIGSKAQPFMQQKIQKWLLDQDLYHQTGVLEDNAHFVKEYIDEAQVVQELGISIFYDSAKSSEPWHPYQIVEERILWMNPSDTLLIQIIPKDQRRKIAWNHGNWNKTMKYFQKIPTKKHSSSNSGGCT